MISRPGHIPQGFTNNTKTRKTNIFIKRNRRSFLCFVKSRKTDSGPSNILANLIIVVASCSCFSGLRRSFLIARLQSGASFSQLQNFCERLENFSASRYSRGRRNAAHLSTHLNFSLINHIKVVALVALLDDGFPGQTVHGEHRVEDVGALVLVQVREQNVLADCFR